LHCESLCTHQSATSTKPRPEPVTAAATPLHEHDNRALSASIGRWGDHHTSRSGHDHVSVCRARGRESDSIFRVLAANTLLPIISEHHICQNPALRQHSSPTTRASRLASASRNNEWAGKAGVWARCAGRTHCPSGASGRTKVALSLRDDGDERVLCHDRAVLTGLFGVLGVSACISLARC